MLKSWVGSVGATLSVLKPVRLNDAKLIPLPNRLRFEVTSPTALKLFSKMSEVEVL